MSTEVEVPELPNCNFCESSGVITPAEFDGRTTFGAWANMCDIHWTIFGCARLGTGFGQRLIKKGTK